MSNSLINKPQDLSGFQNLFSDLVIRPEAEASQQSFLESVDQGQLNSFKKRLAVYRNNVHHSLTQALADIFPVVQQLVGEDFFSLMAKEYLYVSPPSSPVLLEFGDGFAAFIESFEPARPLNYLSDVAKLEYQWQKSCHAIDVPSVDADYFAAIEPDSLYQQSLVCHPSLQLIHSDYAVGSIWQQHQQSLESLQSIDVDQAEWLVIVRPEYEVQICFMDEPGYRFIDLLRGNASLGSAITELSGVFPEWDIGQALAFSIQNGFFIGFQKQPTETEQTDLANTTQ